VYLANDRRAHFAAAIPRYILALVCLAVTRNQSYFMPSPEKEIKLSGFEFGRLDWALIYNASHILTAFLPLNREVGMGRRL